MPPPPLPPGLRPDNGHGSERRDSAGDGFSDSSGASLDRRITKRFSHATRQDNGPQIRYDEEARSLSAINNNGNATFRQNSILVPQNSKYPDYYPPQRSLSRMANGNGEDRPVHNLHPATDVSTATDYRYPQARSDIKSPDIPHSRPTGAPFQSPYLRNQGSYHHAGVYPDYQMHNFNPHPSNHHRNDPDEAVYQKTPPAPFVRPPYEYSPSPINQHQQQIYNPSNPQLPSSARISHTSNSISPFRHSNNHAQLSGTGRGPGLISGSASGPLASNWQHSGSLTSVPLPSSSTSSSTIRQSLLPQNKSAFSSPLADNGRKQHAAGFHLPLSSSSSSRNAAINAAASSGIHGSGSRLHRGLDRDRNPNRDRDRGIVSRHFSSPAKALEKWW